MKLRKIVLERGDTKEQRWREREKLCSRRKKGA